MRDTRLSDRGRDDRTTVATWLACAVCGAMAIAAHTMGGCGPFHVSPPPQTAPDVGKDVACVAGDLLGGVLDPAKVKADCGLATVQVAIDLIGSLLGFRDQSFHAILVKLGDAGPPGPTTDAHAD